MSPTTIDDIPSEILFRIFSYYVRSEGNKNLLDNVSNVCLRWREAALMPALWSDIKVHKQMETSVVDLREFAEKGLLSHTRNLMVIDNHCRLGRDDFKAIISKCQRLQDLYVYGVGLSIDSTDVAVNCPGLEKLQLLNRRLFPIPDFKFNIHKFKACCPRMKELTLRNVSFECADDEDPAGLQMLESFTCCSELTDRELYLIVGNSLRLRRLDTPNRFLMGALKLSSGKLQKVEYLHSSLGSPGDVCAEILRKWKHSLRSLKAIVFEDLFPCDIGEALRRLVDEDEEGSTKNPISFVQLHRVYLKLDDLAYFVSYAGNLSHLDVREVYLLPKEYRREYSSEESVKSLRQSLMKDSKVDVK